jgi:hypothetical protein
VIGVDANQNMVKPGFVLTSMIKRVDQAVYQIVKDVTEKRFTSGLHVFGLESEGVGYVVDEYNRSLLSPRSHRCRRGRETEDHRGRDQGDRCDVSVMLSLRGITKRFGGVVANDHIDITVEPGTIHAIVGEKRRRKVDRYADRLRLLHGRRRRDPHQRTASAYPAAARRHRPRHRDGASALHAG